MAHVNAGACNRKAEAIAMVAAVQNDWQKALGVAKEMDELIGMENSKPRGYEFVALAALRFSIM